MCVDFCWLCFVDVGNYGIFFIWNDVFFVFILRILVGWEFLVLCVGSLILFRLLVYILIEEWWFIDLNIYLNNFFLFNEWWCNWWKYLLFIWCLIMYKFEILMIFLIMYRVYVMKIMNGFFFIVSNDNGMFSNNIFVKLCKI